MSLKSAEFIENLDRIAQFGIISRVVIGDMML